VETKDHSAASQCPTILLVEDDPDTLSFMVTWLEAEGYRIRTAGNGSEALEILRQEVPNVMVVDLMMPIMDGAELRRCQQKMPAVSRVPFVLVSGTHDPARIAKDLGITDVFSKPFDADRLLGIVASHCHRTL
jgi:CheY-like chemotaxis protein